MTEPQTSKTAVRSKGIQGAVVSATGFLGILTARLAGLEADLSALADAIGEAVAAAGAVWQLVGRLTAKGPVTLRAPKE